MRHHLAREFKTAERLLADAMGTPPINRHIARQLREMADVLADQGEDGFRVGAYRRAAAMLDHLQRAVDEIVATEGVQGLVNLPSIGDRIAGAIMEMISSGRWSQLERVKGGLNPIALFRTLPGIGPKLAQRLHDDLQVDTLEQLEVAAAQGRLDRMEGVGPRRAAIIRAQLSERLGRRHLPAPLSQLAPIELLLDIDREYRERAAAGGLRKIAPKRLNPTGAAWLPIMHARRGAWDFTALFSNTEQAHRLNKTNDWVVVYFHNDGSPEAQCTIVTETNGVCKGQRVVRGREAERADLRAVVQA